MINGELIVNNPIPAALVRANLPELCVAERTPNCQVREEQSGQLKFA